MNNIIKKSLVSALSAGLLTLTGCQGSGFLAPKAPDLDKKFSFAADIVCGEENFSANISREGVGKWKVELTEPYQVQGMCFNCSISETKADFGGLGQTALTEDFSGSAVSDIVEALENAVLDPNGAVTYTDDIYTVQWGDCAMTFPHGSGAPTEFEIAAKRIKGAVTDFRITGEIFENGAEVVEAG